MPVSGRIGSIWWWTDCSKHLFTILLFPQALQVPPRRVARMVIFVPKTQMKLTPGQYWKEEPAISILEEVKCLNTIGLNAASRLCLLPTSYVGSILLVAHLYVEMGPTTAPFIMILAAPAVVTYNEVSADHGVLLDDIWDETALASFHPSLDVTGVNCPFLVAQEGYSRAANITSHQIESMLLDAQPLLIPEGQDLVGILSCLRTHIQGCFSHQKFAIYHWACIGHLLLVFLIF
jgi:hypothetical protein